MTEKDGADAQEIGRAAQRRIDRLADLLNQIQQQTSSSPDRLRKFQDHYNEETKKSKRGILGGLGAADPSNDAVMASMERLMGDDGR